MASINGVSLPYTGGATNSANVRTPAEENTNKTAIQSVTAPQAGSRSVVGAANDLSATQTVSSLVDVRSSATNSALNAPPPPPPPGANSSSASNQAGLSSPTEPVQQNTVNAIENQLQTARFKQQTASSSQGENQTATSATPNQAQLASPPQQTESSTASSQKAYISSQTAEKGLGLSIDTRS